LSSLPPLSTAIDTPFSLLTDSVLVSELDCIDR
jgi:hypothetical protein